MASGKTETYGLNQWEATDKVERLDFNSDNEKLDAALKVVETKADTAQQAAETAQIMADEAWSAGNVVVGSYTGNGSSNGASKTITLGFKPSLLFVQRLSQESTGSNCAVCAPGYSYTASSGTLLALTDTGFTVKYYRSSTNWTGSPNLNNDGITYIYVAFR